ncbi:hypothetical protein LVB87_11410 [Lysobacter sp. KIS68-7]|uniref:hypothetical protein n=1 Tax=Lysobacter sp. KIS68-7 TaxID=2904252 RepID=UPI001E506D2E|nr:hypothetical protein [Lysobacter sp. KIS68-7]UHQ18789.1 hypothetical protein LVB87_11410 [Lysobacter sp. KIS68-7]
MRSASSKVPWVWLTLAAIALAGFALVMNAMFERSNDTAGRSEASHRAPATESQPAYNERAPDTDVSVSDQFTTDSRDDIGPLIYKCASPSGAIAYQSDPCEDAQTLRKTIIAVPDDPDVVARGQAQQARTADAARTLSRMAGTDQAGYASPYNGMDDVDRQRAKCNAAKSARESTLRAVGLSRTYDLLQNLDEQVREACKGT